VAFITKRGKANYIDEWIEVNKLPMPLAEGEQQLNLLKAHNDKKFPT